MLRPIAPDPELIEWLWTDEGLDWHISNIRRIAHAQGGFAEIKFDHECDPADCTVNRYSPHPDHLIATEIRQYGISGVPEEWKQR